MAYTVVQHITGQNATTPLAVAYGVNVTAGNLLLAFAFNNKLAQVNSVSDSLNGAWTLSSRDNNTYSTDAWLFPNTLGGACTVTLTAPTSTNTVLMLAEVSGTSATPTDGAAANDGVHNNANVTFNTTQNGDFVFGGCVMDNSAGAVGNGFTMIDNISNEFMTAFRVQTNFGNTFVGFLNTAPGTGLWQICGAAFKTGGAAPPTIFPAPTLHTMGVGR